MPLNTCLKNRYKINGEFTKAVDPENARLDFSIRVNSVSMERVEVSAATVTKEFSFVLSRLSNSEDFSVEIKTPIAGAEIITMTFRKVGRGEAREIKVLKNGQEISLIKFEPILPEDDNNIKYGLNVNIKVSF